MPQEPQVGQTGRILEPPVGQSARILEPPIGGVATVPGATQPDAQHPFVQDVLAGLWKQQPIHPIDAVGNTAEAIRHPITTAGAILENQGKPYERMKDKFSKGDYAGGAVELLNWMLPILGPQISDLNARNAAGQVTPGQFVGESLGLGLQGATLAPGGPKAIAQTVGDVVQSDRLAEMAKRMSGRQMTDVIKPTTGPNRIRLANQAAAVAPELAAAHDMGAASRTGLAMKVADRLTEAEAGLDAAADARNPGHAYPTAPIIADLQAARARLTAQAVEGSHPTPAMTGTSPSGLVRTPEAVPLGSDVVPGPNSTRVAQIDAAIDELRQLGPMARYDALKTIRQSYDQVAKVKYSPAVSPDFLANQAKASGAADVTAVLRDRMAGFDPATAAANKTYAFWRKANDVIQAAEEVDRARPKVGRQIGARLAGVIGGGASGGTLGAVTGAILAPTIETGIAAMTEGRKIAVARSLASLSDALKTGDAGRIETALRTLRLATVMDTEMKR